MNIALGTLFLFLLVIPGISFRFTFYFGPRTKKRAKLSAFDDFIWGIIPGLSFQLIGAYIINSTDGFWFGYKIDFVSFGKILYADGAADEFLKVENYLGEILIYNAGLILFAGIIGYLVRKSIHLLHLDHRFQFVRFNNEWHYFLRGETSFFYPTWESVKATDRKQNWFKRTWERYQDLKKQREERRKDRRDFNSCTAYIVTKSSDDKIRRVFKGEIKNFYLLPDGQLDTIWLLSPERCLFSDLDARMNWVSTNVKVLALKGSDIVDIGIVNNTIHVNDGGKDPGQALAIVLPIEDCAYYWYV